MKIELQPTSITCYDGERVIAHVHWRFECDYIYIDEIKVSDDNPRCLVLMYTKFRAMFPGRTVWFDAADDNPVMQRFVELVKAKSNSRTYRTTMKGIFMPPTAEQQLKKLNSKQKAKFTADANAEAAPQGQNPTTAPKSYHLLITGYYLTV